MAFNIERSGEFFNKEILKHITGAELAKSVILDSTNLQTYNTRSDGRIVALAGTVLEVSGSDVDEVQVITILGVPTGGTFKLGWNDVATSALAYNVSAADLETALDGLDGLEDTDIEVTGSAGGPYTLTFGNRFSGKDVPLISVVDEVLTGGTDPRITVATTVEAAGKKVKPAATSGVAQAAVVGILAYDVEFFGEDADKYDEPAAAFIYGCLFDVQKLTAYSANETNVKAALSACQFL